MATTKHMNLQEIATGAVEWPAIVNDLINKVEAGRTIKATAGEALTKGDPFYIKASDNKAWKATNATECLGVWQSANTTVGAEGFGQVDGIMVFGSWASGNLLLYVSSAGALTTTATGNGTPVAITISTTEIFIIAQLRLKFADVAALLAVADADVSFNSKKLTNVADPTAATDAATKGYADKLVVGLLNDRGSYDASGNTFPASGGSGPAGAILKGDLWFISVAGTLGGVAVNVGDSIRALTDAPGQIAANWSIFESNIGYVPAKVAGDASQVFSASGFKISEAANGKQGTAVLVGGTATVNNTSITANSRILLTSQVDGGIVGFLRVSSRVVGKSFTITSSSALDTSTVAYFILEPA